MPEPVDHLFSAETLAVCRPELRFAYRGKIGDNWQSGRFTPAWFSCWYLEKGWGEARYDDGQRLQVAEGQWLLSPPYLPRYQTFDRDATLLSLAFQLPLPPGLDSRPHLPRLLLNDDLGLRAPALALVEALSGIATPDAPRQRHQISFAGWLAAQQALATFIVIWMRTWDLTPGEEIATDPRVRLAQVHLASNARIDHVPYDDLATTTGLGRVQLDRLFKQQLGRSPKAELDRLCLERVLRRLADRSRSLKGIASELGFTDTSHLCRWFRRLSGVSPEQHRRSAAL